LANAFNVKTVRNFRCAAISKRHSYVGRRYLLSAPTTVHLRLSFFTASQCAPANIAPEKSTRPFYLIDSRVRAFTRIGNVAPKRGYRQDSPPIGKDRAVNLACTPVKNGDPRRQRSAFDPLDSRSAERLPRITSRSHHHRQSRIRGKFGQFGAQGSACASNQKRQQILFEASQDNFCLWIPKSNIEFNDLWPAFIDHQACKQQPSKGRTSFIHSTQCWGYNFAHNALS
jgi:hypothetical protein